MQALSAHPHSISNRQQDQDGEPLPHVLSPVVQAAPPAKSILFSSATDESCKDRYYNCNVVVQARLCVYNYYKTACCASCTRVANRHPGFLGSR